MVYQAFYCCHQTNEYVSPEDACEMDLALAQERALDFLQGADDFFGLIDESGTTLQFATSGGSIWMEIPVPAERGSYGKHISLAEVGPLIAALPAYINLNDFAEMQFQPW